MKPSSLFSDRNFNRDLLKLALPIAFQNLMLALVAAADALMLGALEQNIMSAVSLATQVQFVQNCFLYAIAEALSVLGSQYFGKNDHKSVVDLHCIALRWAMTVSVITFLLCIFFPGQLMTILTDDEELIAIGVRYLKISGWSYLLTGISQCYLTTIKMTGHATQATTISTVTVILNIILNAILIFGLFGISEMKEQGAALATLIARIVELLWCIIICRLPGFIHPKIPDYLHFNKSLSTDFTVSVLPMLGASLLWGVGFASYSAFMGHFEQDTAAANSVAAVVRDLVCSLCNGLASGGAILLGYSLGKGDLETGKKVGTKLMILSFIFGIISTIIMLCVTPILLLFVKLTDGAKDILAGMMVIMAFYMIGRTVNTVTINGVFYSGGDVRFDVYSLIVTMWCMAVPLAFLGTFIFDWNPLVVYAMTCLDEVGKIPWVIYHFKKYKWVKDLTREEIANEAR